jgi:hypothetical protein
MGSPAMGFLHVVMVGRIMDPVHADYRITFTPLEDPLRDRRHVTRQGLDALTDFLRLAGVPSPEIERTWRTLARDRAHSIPRIALTPAQVEALGL